MPSHSATLYGTNYGLQIENNYGSVTAQFGPYSHADIDRGWIEKLRCPNSLAVKNSLKQAKDKLLRQSFDWVLHNPQYRSWRYGNDICLLWIKGGAGKGKTMMSIGLIEVLSQEHDIGRSAVVIYFFCQNADNELNTVSSIIKGLIFGLISQRDDLRESLRRRWDSTNDRFTEDLNSWRALWSVFLEMLEHCDCPRIYIIVDALDECRDKDHDMADFLKFIVRNGADRPSKIKWILTSRPLDTAECYLVPGHEQVQVSLELNSECVSDAVNHYISYRVEELSLLQRYGERLKREIQTSLIEKAEGTYLWVSLVCKRLEMVCRDEALPTILNLPLGLPSLYNQIFDHLNRGEPETVQRCLRLLKVMTLVYRPLRLEEVSSVTGLTDEEDTIKALIDRCASFINLQENNIRFVHQSARDFLTDENTALDLHETFGHNEIVLSCLSHLSKHLETNMMELPRPDSTKAYISESQNKERNTTLLASLDYPAIFWVQHLENIRESVTEQHMFADTGTVATFLRTKLLEWLECISLLGRLSKAIEALQAMRTMTRNHSPASSVFKIIKDALQFLMRHYYAIANWPLQIYSSAIIFSPESSIVKKENINKIPSWLLKVPTVEQNWTSHIQTIEAHSKRPRSVAFSPDGKQIVSGSDGTTIKIWDSTTGDLLKTLAGHSGSANTVVFSPDGKQIVSGSFDGTIRLWDATTGDLLKTLTVHSGPIKTVAFSPDGQKIVFGCGQSLLYKRFRPWDCAVFELQMILLGHSGPIRTAAWPDGKLFAFRSFEKNVQVWDTTTAEVGKTLAGHSGSVNTVAFSPDGKQIVSGSFDRMIRLWDATTGELINTFAGHSRPVMSVAFSPDGKQIVSGSADKKVKLWNATTGKLQKTLVDHSGSVKSVAFSPDGNQFASGSDDSSIILWDATTGSIRKKLATRVNSRNQGYYSDEIWALAFSPDGKQIACCSGEHSIKLWDTTITTDDVQLERAPACHSSWVMSVRFSPNGKQIASSSFEGQFLTVNIWDSATGHLQKTLTGFGLLFKAPAYVYRDIIRNAFSSYEPYLGFMPPLKGLGVKDQWIYYKGSRILLLPPDFNRLSHETLGNQICLGFRNGRVLSFNIDRNELQSILTGGSE